MKPRYWYGLDKKINPLGFGCWQLIGKYYKNNKPHGWGPMDEKEAIRLIQHALDQGIHFFDTATGYGDGRSEEILGKGISTTDLEDTSVICTKIPLKQDEINQGKLDKNFIPKVDASLKRLKRNQIDILLLHNPPDDVNWSYFDTSVLEELKNKGKIATYGVSCKTLQGAKNVIEANFGTCLEWVFHLLERRPVEQIFTKLQNKKMNFIGRSPLARGLLTSKYLKNDPVFKNNDFRSTIDKDWIKWILHSIRNINGIDKYESNLSQLALRYCISYDELSVTIPGFKKIDQLNTALDAMKKGPIDKGAIHIIDNQMDKTYPAWL